MRPHDPCGALLADAFAQLAQRRVHPRTAVRALAVAMDHPDLLQHSFVVALGLGQRTFAPGVVAARVTAYTRHMRADAVHFPMRFDELEDFCLRSEMNRMDFFRMSCSSLSRS